MRLEVITFGGFGPWPKSYGFLVIDDTRPNPIFPDRPLIVEASDGGCCTPESAMKAGRRWLACHQPKR